MASTRRGPTTAWPHWRRLDLRDVRDGAPIKFAAFLRPTHSHWLIFSQVRALRGLLQAHEPPVLGARVDRLVVLRHLGDALSGDLDAAGPALETAGAAVSASTYDVSRAPSARARISDARPWRVSPLLLSPP